MLRYSVEKTIEMVVEDIRKINPYFEVFCINKNFIEVWIRDKAKIYKTVNVKKYIK